MSVSQDEKERAVYRSRKMYQTDLQSNLNTAFDKGEKNKALTVAKNALEMNLSVADIERLTGLSEEEIGKLIVKG